MFSCGSNSAVISCTLLTPTSCDDVISRRRSYQLLKPILLTAAAAAASKYWCRDKPPGQSPGRVANRDNELDPVDPMTRTIRWLYNIYVTAWRTVLHQAAAYSRVLEMWKINLRWFPAQLEEKLYRSIICELVTVKQVTFFACSISHQIYSMQSYKFSSRVWPADLMPALLSISLRLLLVVIAFYENPISRFHYQINRKQVDGFDAVSRGGSDATLSGIIGFVHRAATNLSARRSHRRDKLTGLVTAARRRISR